MFVREEESEQAQSFEVVRRSEDAHLVWLECAQVRLEADEEGTLVEHECEAAGIVEERLHMCHAHVGLTNVDDSSEARADPRETSNAVRAGAQHPESGEVGQDCDARVEEGIRMYVLD